MIKTSSLFLVPIGQIVHLFDRFNDSAIYVGQVFLKNFVNSSLDFLNRKLLDFCVCTVQKFTAITRKSFFFLSFLPSNQFIKSLDNTVWKTNLKRDHKFLKKIVIFSVKLKQTWLYAHFTT